jgi:hypothetical protein
MTITEVKVIKEYSSANHKMIYAFLEDGGSRAVFGIFKVGRVWDNDTYNGTTYNSITDAIEHAKEIAENNFEYVRNSKLNIR